MGEKSIIEEMDSVIAKALGQVQRKQNIALEILKLALKVEELTREHYSSLADKVPDKGGRAMFKYLADEEARHIQSLKVQEESLKKDRRWLLKERVGLVQATCPLVSPKKGVRGSEDILPEESEVRKNTTDLEALGLAIEVKKRAIRFYCTAASKIDDAQGKKMFAHLVEIEEKHLNELEVQYEWLEQSGFWYNPEMMTD